MPEISVTLALAAALIAVGSATGAWLAYSRTRDYPDLRELGELVEQAQEARRAAVNALEELAGHAERIGRANARLRAERARVESANQQRVAENGVDRFEEAKRWLSRNDGA